MTQPSRVLEAIAAALRAQLQPGLASDPLEQQQSVDVVVTDHMLDDVSGIVTFRAPAVVLSVTGLPDIGRELGPLSGMLQVVARCYARLPASPGRPPASQGSVAMDLAAAVAQRIDGAVWHDPEGQELSITRAERVRVSNRTTPAVAAKGHAMWSVTWQQAVELTQLDVAATLHALRTLHFDVLIGDADTPDQSATLELEGGTLP